MPCDMIRNDDGGKSRARKSGDFNARVEGQGCRAVEKWSSTFFTWRLCTLWSFIEGVTKNSWLNYNFSSRKMFTLIHQCTITSSFSTSVYTRSNIGATRPATRESRHRNVPRRILESYRVFIFDDRPRYTRTLLCVRLYVAMRSVCTCILVARSSRTATARAAELSTFPIGQKSVAGPRDSELEALYETERPASRFANKEQ